MNLIKIGTRGSRLALWQANYIAAKLLHIGWNTKIITIETKGDKSLDTTIAKIGSKGVFTEEIEEQLREGSIDIAVHSAKDMPSQIDDDLQLIAFSEREIPCDVLVSNKDVNLSQSIRVGTSSTRRVGLLKHFYPGIEIVPIRGNLQTRFEKMEQGHCDGLLLAYAGVHRMGYTEMIREKLPMDRFIPPVGQGSIVVQSATTVDRSILEAIRSSVNIMEVENNILAERAFLRTLEGGCSIPSFCHATTSGGTITLHGGVVSLDGGKLVAEQIDGPVHEGEKIGIQLAQSILNSGGASILDEIKNM